MSPRIDGSPSYRPENDEPQELTREQLVKLRSATTPEERIKILGKKQTNEVQERHFKARGEDAPKSPLGQRLSDGFDRATTDLPAGGKFEVSAEAAVGQGLEATARAKIEVANLGHGWEVARAIGGGVAAGAHAGGILEGKAGLAIDFAEHYEYATREAAGSAATAMAQQPLPDDIQDPDLDLRLDRLQYARTATSFSVSSELIAKAGGAVGPFGADAEGKLASTVRVKVEERSGDVAVEFGPEASARIGARAGASAGPIGASVGEDFASVGGSMKAEFRYKLTDAELKLWNETRDPRVLGPAIARGAVAAKVTETAEMLVAGERFTGARELSLDASGHRVEAGIKNDFAWTRGASTRTVALGADVEIPAVKLDARVSNPGVKMIGVSTEDLRHSGLSLQRSDANIAAHRARANVGH